MNKKAIKDILMDYYTQYKEYNSFFEKYIDSLKDKEADLLVKVQEGAQVEDIKDTAIEVFLLKRLYADDLHILSDRLVIWYDINLNFGNKINQEITELTKKLRVIVKSTKFILINGQLEEKEQGYLDHIKKTVEEQGLLEKLLKGLIESQSDKKE